MELGPNIQDQLYWDSQQNVIQEQFSIIFFNMTAFLMRLSSKNKQSRTLRHLRQKFKIYGSYYLYFFNPFIFMFPSQIILEQQLDQKKILRSIQMQIKLQEKENALDRAKVNFGPFSINRDDLDQFGEFKKNADWATIQNAKYVAFIEANIKKMEGKPHGKLWGVYQDMAKIVKTRNFRQCKSHHQKMLNKHKTIPEIISFFLKANSKFQVMVSKERQNLQQVEIPVYNLNQYVEQVRNEKDPKQKKTAEQYMPEQQQYGYDISSKGQFGNYQNVFNYQIPKNKSDEWRECHQLFIQWTSRLKSLMMPPHY